MLHQPQLSDARNPASVGRMATRAGTVVVCSNSTSALSPSSLLRRAQTHVPDTSSASYTPGLMSSPIRHVPGPNVVHGFGPGSGVGVGLGVGVGVGSGVGVGVNVGVGVSVGVGSGVGVAVGVNVGVGVGSGVGVGVGVEIGVGIGTGEGVGTAVSALATEASTVA